MYISVERLALTLSRVHVCRQSCSHFVTTLFSVSTKKGKERLCVRSSVRRSSGSRAGEQSGGWRAAHRHGTPISSRGRRRFQAKSSLVPGTDPPTRTWGTLSELPESSLKFSSIQREFRSSAASHLCDVH